MKNLLLETINLSKSYIIGKNNYQVLNNINLQVQDGELISLMGPSGSGKSTLLYNLSGMDNITSGRVLFNGQDLSSLSEKELSDLRLHKMGFIFQQIHLLKNLSIFDNIVLSAYLAKMQKYPDIECYAMELMEKMGIATLSQNAVTQASGGQLQRVAICRALINNPELIFADEPTGALNSSTAQEVMEIFTMINKIGKTIILATHDLKIASWANRIIYLLDGKIAGEMNLGKYDYQYKIERDKKVSDWLMTMKF